MTARRHALWLALAASGAATTPARAESRSGHSGLRESLGPPRAPHAMSGVDATRSRSSRTQLSQTPRVERRLRVAYGIGRGLVTREDGGFFVLHPTARASRFDAQGKLLFSLKLPTEPASAAVVTSSGAIAFVAGGELFRVDGAGRVLSRTELGDADFTARSILATQDGGVAVASNSVVLKLSASGALSFRRTIAETALELLETTAGLLCVSAPGSVYRLDGAGRINKLGELGGTTFAVTAGTDLLLARTGSHRLVNFDLRQHRPRAVVEDATLDLDGPVLLGAERVATAFTSDGLLVRYRADGSEAERIPFDPGARKAPGSEDALLLADGRLLLARAGADVVVVTPAGEVAPLPNSACPDPLGLFAAGPKSVLLACRSGNMLRLE